MNINNVLRTPNTDVSVDKLHPWIFLLQFCEKKCGFIYVTSLMTSKNYIFVSENEISGD